MLRSHALAGLAPMLVAIWCLTLLDCPACHAADKPNIVVYLSDDHSQFDSSLYGNDNIPTPNFEKLAADGMTFTNAFVASPSCAPSRAALLTGLMPARNGAEENHTKPREGFHSLILDLKAQGYEVVAFGKVAHYRHESLYDFDKAEFVDKIGKLRTVVAEYLKNRDSDKPLCLFVGTTNPHVPWARQSSFDPAEVELPPYHLDTPSTRAHRAAYYEEIKQLDTLMGDLRRMVNRHVGEHVFVHTSDHGSQWPFGKWNLYDYGICVPMIISWPGEIEAGTQTDAMVSWVDVIPTLLDIAGGKSPEDIDGRSFKPVLLGQATTHRDYIYTTHSADGKKNRYPIRSVRTAEWKLIHNLHPEASHTNHSDLDRKPLAGEYWNEWMELAEHDERAREIIDRYHHRPEWELYHVSDDKWERTNLIDDPQYADLVSDLQQKLADWMQAQGDQGH